jgi:serine/threonine protein kinase
MVLEYMSEGNLAHLLHKKERSDFKPTDLLQLATNIVNGMSYLEENHILHRDLALRNVLATRDTAGQYIAKISDFGMSRLIDSGIYSSTNSTIPIKWSAPENLQYGKYTSKSDVWSFGVALWELYSFGMIPYPGLGNNEVLKKIVEEEYRMPAPPDCPEEIYAIMLQCWKTKPSDRPSFVDLAQRFRNMLHQAVVGDHTDNQSQTKTQYSGNYSLTNITLGAHYSYSNPPYHEKL